MQIRRRNVTQRDEEYNYNPQNNQLLGSLGKFFDPEQKHRRKIRNYAVIVVSRLIKQLNFAYYLLIKSFEDSQKQLLKCTNGSSKYKETRCR